MDSEEKYSDIREKLRNLEQVKASDNFVHNLHHKIVGLEAEKRKMHVKKFDEGRGGFLKNLFANSQYPWLIPAVGFTVIIFFVLYMTFLNKNIFESNNNKEQASTQEPGLQNNNNVPSETNKTNKTNTDMELPVTPESSNQNFGERDLSKKDIAGDLKKEHDKNLNAQRELSKQNPGKDNSQNETKNNETKENFETKEMNETNGINTFAQDTEKKINLSKENSEPESLQENGIMEKSARESTFAKITGEASENAIPEDEASNKKLIEKLDAIDKTNLEKLRDKILDN